MKANPTKYLVITPVKDEEMHVERTLQSMVCQSVQPACWIIVDDGSSDRTAEIVEGYARKHSFLRLLKLARGRARQPGAAVVRAFNEGYAATRGMDYDFIVKLDCDLSFEPTYFEQLMKKFLVDPRLAIASGVYLEAADGVTWSEVPMPPYHAAGASKMIRRPCFEAIGGFVPARGWDTVDEIRAMARGWRTAHFRDLKMRHWKPEGSGIGPMRTSIMHGEIFYRTGGSKVFFLLKVLHRLRSRPFLLGGLALSWGYLRSLIRRQERLVTTEEARCYRALLRARITGKFKTLLPTT